MASPLRLNAALIEAAEREGAVQKRSVPRQIEFWAELGKAVESIIGPADVVAVIQGIKKIKVEPVTSTAADPADVFYETSLSRPGLLDRVNTATGERQTGLFRNGEFRGTIIPVKEGHLTSVAEHPFWSCFRPPRTGSSRIISMVFSPLSALYRFRLRKMSATVP
jgi:hypothetical protein